MANIGDIRNSTSGYSEVYDPSGAWRKLGATNYSAEGKLTESETGLALNNPINSEILQPRTEISVTEPNTVPIYPVSSLDPFYQMTAPEQQVQSGIENLQNLNQQLLGQSAYRAEQEKLYNIPTEEKTFKDLSSRLTALKNEALAIPMQLQEESAGRGRTRASIGVIETGRLRQNAIQALSVSAMLSASQGNLTYAKDQVERAVAQKFDPIKEEIAAKTANLQLIMQSPEYSLADKKRAKTQEEYEKAVALKLAKEQENYDIVQAMVMAAVKNYPDTETLMAAKQAQSLDSSDENYLYNALALLGQYQTNPYEIQKQIDEHLTAQANIKKLEADLSMIPLDIAYKQAQLRNLQAEYSALTAPGQTLISPVTGTPAESVLPSGEKNRVLKQDEIEFWGVPSGSLLSDIWGKTPTSANIKKMEETVEKSYQGVQGILTEKNIDLSASKGEVMKQISKLNAEDIKIIGRALYSMSNPTATRPATDDQIANMFKPETLAQRIRMGIRRELQIKNVGQYEYYLPKVYETLMTAETIRKSKGLGSTFNTGFNLNDLLEQGGVYIGE